MRKTLLCALAVVAVAGFTSAMAKQGDQITLLGGTTAVFYERVIGNFKSDWTHTQVLGQDSAMTWMEYLQTKGDDYVQTWDEDRAKTDLRFGTGFYTKFRKKGIRFYGVDSGETAKYTTIAHIEEIDPGSIGGGIVAYALLGPLFSGKAGGMMMNGTVDIVDNESGNIVCQLAFHEVRGSAGSISQKEQLRSVITDLAIEIAAYALRHKDESLPIVAAAAPAANEGAAASDSPAPGIAAPQNVAAPQQSTVRLKNGTSVSGVIKSLDPLKEVTLNVAGIETTIPMSEVEGIDAAAMAAPAAMQSLAAPLPRESRPAVAQPAEAGTRSNTSREWKRGFDFSANAHHYGTLHAGYGLTKEIDGYDTHTANVTLGTIQGVEINRHIQVGIGIDGFMYTHYLKGTSIRYGATGYGDVRFVYPFSPKFSVNFGGSFGAMVSIDPKPEGAYYYMELGPGLVYKKLMFRIGLQKLGKSVEKDDHNHLFVKLGFHFDKHKNK